jgi:hypothetical protein
LREQLIDENKLREQLRQNWKKPFWYHWFHPNYKRQTERDIENAIRGAKEAWAFVKVFDAVGPQPPLDTAYIPEEEETDDIPTLRWEE